MSNKKRQLVGYAGVDSGTLMITDPCYALEDDRGPDYKKESTYLKAVMPTPHEPFNYAHDTVIKSVAGNAIICSTAYGDGTYPVYVEYDDDGRPLRMTVELQ